MEVEPGLPRLESGRVRLEKDVALWPRKEGEDGNALRLGEEPQELATAAERARRSGQVSLALAMRSDPCPNDSAGAGTALPERREAHNI